MKVMSKQKAEKKEANKTFGDPNLTKSSSKLSRKTSLTRIRTDFPARPKSGSGSKNQQTMHDAFIEAEKEIMVITHVGRSAHHEIRTSFSLACLPRCLETLSISKAINGFFFAISMTVEF